MPTQLTPGHIHVAYRATAATDDASQRADVLLLSNDERTRYERFVFERDKRDFAAAHALLRRTLSMFAAPAPGDWRFDGAANQKPRVSVHQAGEPPLRFSLSHTRGLVACAVSRGLDVGIDVESADRHVDAHNVARRFFSPAEVAMLDACAGDEERAAKFLAVWTLKEAYVKAIGAGLSVPLDRFAFTFDVAGRIVFAAEPDMDSGPFAFTLLSPSPAWSGPSPFDPTRQRPSASSPWTPGPARLL